jgi:hypothetical protein
MGNMNLEYNKFFFLFSKNSLCLQGVSKIVNVIAKKIGLKIE